MCIRDRYGGPDGEMGASMRYLSQRYSMPYGEQKAVLTDIGTEELAHLEMIAAIVHQLTRNLSAEELEAQGFAPYYICLLYTSACAGNGSGHRTNGAEHGGTASLRGHVPEPEDSRRLHDRSRRSLDGIGNVRRNRRQLWQTAGVHGNCIHGRRFFMS